MSIGFWVFVGLIALLVIYIILQTNSRTRDKGVDKLINRNKPPYDIDNTTAGGGTTGRKEEEAMPYSPERRDQP